MMFARFDEFGDASAQQIQIYWNRLTQLGYPPPTVIAGHTAADSLRAAVMRFQRYHMPGSAVTNGLIDVATNIAIDDALGIDWRTDRWFLFPKYQHSSPRGWHG